VYVPFRVKRLYGAANGKVGSDDGDSMVVELKHLGRAVARAMSSK
jgi:hypothetical protein